MKTILYTFLLTAFGFSSFLKANTISINLYLNLNQCNTCNMGLNSLPFISGNVIKNIFFPRSDAAASQELLEPFNNLKNLRLKYYDDKTGPFKNRALKSYCVVFNNKVRVDSFEVNELFSKSQKINALIGFNPVKSILLPESLKLSNRISLSVNNKNVNIFDYTLSKNVLLTLDEKYTKVANVLTIKAQDFKPQPFLRSGIVDTGAYRIFYKYLQYLGKTKPDISGNFLTDSTLYLSLGFPCAISPNGVDTGIGGKMFLYRKNLFTLKSELFAVPETELKSPDKQEYYMDNTAGFFINNNKAYFSLYKEVKSKNNYILAEYSLSKDRVNYKSFVDFTIPDSVFTDYGKNDFFNSSSNHNYYYSTDRPVIVNVKTKAALNLEKELGSKYKKNLKIIDVAGEKDLLRIIVVVNKETKCIVFDTKNKTLISEIRINGLLTANIETLKFLDFNSLICLDSKNKKVMFFRLN